MSDLAIVSGGEVSPSFTRGWAIQFFHGKCAHFWRRRRDGDAAVALCRPGKLRAPRGGRMKEPRILCLGGIEIPFTQASVEALRECVTAPDARYIVEPGDLPGSPAIDKAIAAHLLRERDA